MTLNNCTIKNVSRETYFTLMASEPKRPTGASQVDQSPCVTSQLGWDSNACQPEQLIIKIITSKFFLVFVPDLMSLLAGLATDDQQI